MVEKVTGFLVTFEGTDGSGKTSVINGLTEQLEQLGYQDRYIVTREPGGNKISEAIRHILLDEEYEGMDPKTEVLLYAAARRQHLVQTVLPALKAGKIVLCDRYVESSLVYQGVGRNIGIEPVLAINNFATDELKADLTFVLDIDPEVGLKRIANNRLDEVNRMDKERLEFYQAIRRAYLKLVAKEPQRLVAIDANQELAQVQSDVWRVFESKILATNN